MDRDLRNTLIFRYTPYNFTNSLVCVAIQPSSSALFVANNTNDVNRTFARLDWPHSACFDNAKSRNPLQLSRSI